MDEHGESLSQAREAYAAHDWVTAASRFDRVPAEQAGPGDIVAEVTRLADAGVREITLLGQNVNSWGRDLRPEIETEFGELLRETSNGLAELIGTSGEPGTFTDRWFLERDPHHALNRPVDRQVPVGNSTSAVPGSGRSA